jgi:hypothetical protein
VDIIIAICHPLHIGPDYLDGLLKALCCCSKLVHILISQLLKLITIKILKQGIHYAVTFMAVPVFSLPGSSTDENIYCYRNVNNYQISTQQWKNTFIIFVNPSLHSHVVPELRLNKFSWNLVPKILTKIYVFEIDTDIKLPNP